jgi:hypothetical protein
MRKIFIVILCFLLCQAVKIEDKEETCFVLATRAVVNRESEWNKILKSRPSVSEQTLRNTLIEDSFNFCMKKISPEEVKKFGGTQMRSYKSYAYLVDVAYEKYLGDSKIQQNKKFEDKKIEIAKRVAIKSIEQSNEL